MGLSRDLLYTFTQDLADYVVVHPVTDGDKFYVGVSAGPGTSGGVRVLDFPTPSGDTELGTTSSLSDPEFVQLALNGTDLWVVDRLGYPGTVFGVVSAFNGAVYRVDKATGTPTQVCLCRPGSWGIFERPATGDLWVTDFSSELQVFDAAGAEVTVHNIDPTAFPGLGGGGWAGDVLYLADPFNGEVYAVAPDGTWAASGPLAGIGSIEDDGAVHGGRFYISANGEALYSVAVPALDDLRQETDPAAFDTPEWFSTYGDTLYGVHNNFPDALWRYFPLGGGGWLVGAASLGGGA